MIRIIMWTSGIQNPRMIIIPIFQQEIDYHFELARNWYKKIALERFKEDDNKIIEENESTNSGHKSDDYADASAKKISRF